MRRAVGTAQSRQAPNEDTSKNITLTGMQPDVVSAVRSVLGLVSRALPVQTAMRNCTRDEGGPFEFGNQVLISSHRKLLSSKAMVVSVAEKSGHHPVRQG